eukprot:gene24104-9679_t
MASDVTSDMTEVEAMLLAEALSHIAAMSGMQPMPSSQPGAGAPFAETSRTAPHTPPPPTTTSPVTGGNNALSGLEDLEWLLEAEKAIERDLASLEVLYQGHQADSAPSTEAHHSRDPKPPEKPSTVTAPATGGHTAPRTSDTPL